MTRNGRRAGGYFPALYSMPRPQFSIRALLVATAIAAAFFAGMVVQRQIDEWRYAGYKQWRDSFKDHTPDWP